jgi:hypothetical protein
MTLLGADRHRLLQRGLNSSARPVLFPAFGRDLESQGDFVVKLPLTELRCATPRRFNTASRGACEAIAGGSRDRFDAAPCTRNDLLTDDLERPMSPCAFYTSHLLEINGRFPLRFPSTRTSSLRILAEQASTAPLVLKLSMGMHPLRGQRVGDDFEVRLWPLRPPRICA